MRETLDVLPVQANDSFTSKEKDDSGSIACTVVEHDETHDCKKTLLPKTHWTAWMALFFLVVLRTAISVFQFTYSVVPSTSASFFQVSLSAINWLANVQGLVYVIISFFTGWLFEVIGVKRSLILAGFLNMIGSALRYVAVVIQPPSFALTIAGQIIGSMAAPLALNIMTMFASTWFSENMRATAGMFVASNYGAIIGMFMIPNLVTDVTKIPMMTLIVALMAVGALVPLFFLPAGPPKPPSIVIMPRDKECIENSMAHDDDGDDDTSENPGKRQETPSFFQGLRQISKNVHFWLLFLIHGLNVGNSVAFGTVFTQIIAPYGYTDAQAGQLNAVAFFAGTLGCSISGPVLDITKQHKLFLRLISPMVFVTNLGVIFMLQRDAYASILFVTALNQFFLSFLVPVVTELGSEVSYPVSDAISNSFLWQGAQAFGFLIVFIMDLLRADDQASPPNNMHNALIFQAILSGIMVLLTLIFRGRMARSEAFLLRHNREIS